MRGQTPTRPAKMGLACVPPFFTQRKGEKKRQREPPWGPPGNFDFLGPLWDATMAGDRPQCPSV